MLKLKYSKKEDIPEGYEKLYTEKDSEWVLTGVEGMKTQQDVDNVMESLRKERNDHKETKDKLREWGDLKPKETKEELDKIEEYKLAAEGKMDEDKINQLVDARVKTKENAFAREKQELEDKVTNLEGSVSTLTHEKNNRTIDDSIREAIAGHKGGKMLETAVSDAILIGRSQFEILDDGTVQTREGNGITAGLTPALWLTDMQESRPHWWPASEGGGAGGGSKINNGKNPWTKANWNLTEQGQIIKEHGTAAAEKLAQAAGSKIGATAPTEPPK